MFQMQVISRSQKRSCNQQQAPRLCFAGRKRIPLHTADGTRVYYFSSPGTITEEEAEGEFGFSIRRVICTDGERWKEDRQLYDMFGHSINCLEKKKKKREEEDEKNTCVKRHAGEDGEN